MRRKESNALLEESIAEVGRMRLEAQLTEARIVESKAYQSLASQNQSLLLHAENQAEIIRKLKVEKDARARQTEQELLEFKEREGLLRANNENVVAELRQQYMKLKGEKQELIGKVEQFERA